MATLLPRRGGQGVSLDFLRKVIFGLLVLICLMVGSIFYYGMKEERKIAQVFRANNKQLKAELEICLRDKQ